MAELGKPSTKCESRETAQFAPLAVDVTRSQETSQLRLSFMNVNAKPKKELNAGKLGYRQ
jgi:hypothetical protein